MEAAMEIRETSNDLQAGVELQQRVIQVEAICAQKETAVLLGVLQCKLIAVEAERDRLMVVENFVRDVLDETPVEDDSGALRELRLIFCTEADKEALIEAEVI